MPVEQMKALSRPAEPNVPESKPTIFNPAEDAKASLRRWARSTTRSTGKANFIARQAENRAFGARRTTPSIPRLKKRRTWHSNESLESHGADARCERPGRSSPRQRWKVWCRVHRGGSHVQSDGAGIRAAARSQGEAGNPYNGAAEAMRSVYKDHDPNQTAQWFAQVKQSFDRDPIAATAWAAEQYGLSPLQLAQQIYQRYGQQQSQPTQAEWPGCRTSLNRLRPEPRLEELDDEFSTN